MSQHDRPWFDNIGKPPTKWPRDREIEVQWSNGTPSRHLYKIRELNWELERGEFAIAKYRRA